MNNSDIVFLAHRMNTFICMMQDPQASFKSYREAGMPESADLQIISAALYLLFDCYMRGMGLNLHPRSKTREKAMDKITELYEAVAQEVEARPHIYPKLHGALGRAQGAVELDFLIDGYSRWSEDMGDEG